MTRYPLLYLIVFFVTGCTPFLSHASPNCTIMVTTTRQEADPVEMPPANGYPGKRPVPTIAYPDIPINKFQGGC